MRLLQSTLASLLLASLFTAPAFAGALADHAGNYRASAANPAFCPQDTSLTIGTDTAESSITATYVGPGTVNGVAIAGTTTYDLNPAHEYEVLSMPFRRFGRMLLKGSAVTVQEKGQFELFWQDQETLFQLNEANKVTAILGGMPCAFERI